MKRPIIVGNWKMHGDGTWLERIVAIANMAVAAPDVDVALCVPATLVQRAAALAPRLAIGGQDCHWAQEGAHTGGVSAAMLHEAGARMVILGHSERRMAGDSDAVVAAKVASALTAGLWVVLCVGESAGERDAGTAAACVQAQLRASLPDRIEGELIVAYEPIWAIGRGIVPSPSEIAPVIAAIRTILTEKGMDQARVLYGGSVTAAIAGDLFAHVAIDGLLVGAGSLAPDSFSHVIQMAVGHANLDRPEPSG